MPKAPKGKKVPTLADELLRTAQRVATAQRDEAAAVAKMHREKQARANATAPKIAEDIFKDYILPRMQTAARNGEGSLEVAYQVIHGPGDEYPDNYPRAELLVDALHRRLEKDGFKIERRTQIRAVPYQSEDGGSTGGYTHIILNISWR